jgi:VanZ family protein
MPRSDSTRPSEAKLRYWLPSIVYMAVIFAISSQPNPLPEVTARVSDKLLHLVEYSGLAALFVRALGRDGAGRAWRWRDAVLAAIVMTSLYGASDEYHQAFVPNRNSAVSDWVADSLGAVVGALAYAGVTRRNQLP